MKTTSWYDSLFENIEALSDAEQGQKMSAYMKNKFLFLGIPKPKLKAAIKPFLQGVKLECPDWEFIELCWGKDWREAQYIALEYLAKIQKKLTVEDLPKIKHLITEKSWWDTVDSLDGLVGIIVQKSPELSEEMLKWSLSKNLWLRRVSIDFQQRFKVKTDPQLLEKIVLNNLGGDEFFINKAIGWSLREYSKFNPKWVTAFIEQNREQLSKLSIREAEKYL